MKRFVVGLALAGSLLFALTAAATTLVPLSLEELTARADRVVVGTCVSRQSGWEGTRIVTRSRIEVSETWRGEATDVVEVITLGGVVDGIGQRVDGVQTLAVGERGILFLRRTGDTHAVVGMWQGVFHLSAENGDLQRTARGAELRGTAPAMPASLDELRQAVQGAVR